MSQTIYQIYDKIFKKILTLSSKAVINLINGLFGTDYPEDSSIIYHWTEFEDDELRRILADTIISINGRQSYHLEAQMTVDENIIFRVFEYSFSHANRYSAANGASSELNFPEPKIIYLAPEGSLPDEYVLRLNFGSQGHFDYHVSTFIFNRISTEELNRKKMVILIPFMLLKLQKEISKSRSKHNLEALKKLIENDILGSIEENLRLNNITQMDARKLKRCIHKLYEQIYSHYEEMEELNEMTDESLMLDIDIIEKEHEQRLEEMERAIEEKAHVIKEKDQAIEERNQAIKKKDQALEERNQAIKKKDQVIEERNQIIEKKDQVIEERNQIIEKKDQVIEEKDQVIEEKQHALKEAENALSKTEDTLSKTEDALSKTEDALSKTEDALSKTEDALKKSVSENQTLKDYIRQLEQKLSQGS